VKKGDLVRLKPLCETHASPVAADWHGMWYNRSRDSGEPLLVLETPGRDDVCRVLDVYGEVRWISTYDATIISKKNE
jgi:hypothetical protein